MTIHLIKIDEVIMGPITHDDRGHYRCVLDAPLQRFFESCRQHPKATLQLLFAVFLPGVALGSRKDNREYSLLYGSPV